MKVSKKTYDYVYERDGGACIFCEDPRIDLHHIDGRSRKKTNDVNNCVMLCRCHHKMVQGQKRWIPVLDQYIQTGRLNLTREKWQEAYERKKNDGC